MHDLIEKMKTNMSTSTSNSYQTYTPAQLQGQNISASALISFGQNRTSSSTLNQQSSHPPIKQTFIVPSNQTLSRISANLSHGNPIYYDQSNNNNNNNTTTRQINNCINNYNSYLTNSTSI